MPTIEEYRKMEQEFIDTPALCDDTPPAQCDCSRCPAQEQCKWLCANDPFARKEN